MFKAILVFMGIALLLVLWVGADMFIVWLVHETGICDVTGLRHLVPFCEPLPFGAYPIQ